MVDLLHHTSKDTVSGYYCSIIKSSIMKSCGLFSLEKTLQVPDSEVPQQLSNLQCLDLINSKTYTTKDGQKFTIKIGQENILHFMLDGLVHSSASEGSYCSGSQVKTDTGYVASGFQLVQLKIILKTVTIQSEPNK